MNITENWLNELDSMTETDRRITLGSPEWKELIELARQGLRLQSQLEDAKLPTVEHVQCIYQINTLQNSLEAANRELKVATLKANSSLANNLCPDHRDKQQGKPCLACSLEAAKRDTERLVQVLIEFANASADFMEGEGEPKFSIYEDQMCWAIKALKDNGIDYDPMSGTRHAINAERKEKL